MPTPICDTPSISGVKKDQFEATKKWRKALKNLHEGMPLSTHRRQLRTYTETFTGKDALDFAEQIFPSVFPLCNTRDKSRQLLERFLCCGYITNVRDENCKSFSDNATLYKFCNERIAQILSSSQEDDMNRRRNVFLVRSSSARDRDITDRLQTEQFAAIKTTNLREDLSKMAKLNGRLSISCQDISAMEKQNQGNSSQTKKAGTGILNNLVNIGKASASLFSLNRSNSESSRARQQKCGNVSAFTNSKLFGETRIAVNNNDKICGASQSVFKTCSSTAAHLLPQQQNVRYRAPMSNHSHTVDQNQLARMVFTDADEFKFWRSVIVNWFTNFASFNKLGYFFHANFSGADVRWNCKRINENTGIVQRLREQNGELHRDLLFSLRRLGQWGGTDQSQETFPPANDAVAHFVLVKKHLTSMAPIIPREQAQCLQNVFKHFAHFEINIATKDWTQEELRLYKRLFLGLRLCTLTFPPQLLRNLQILFKCIRQFCFNAKLMQENCWSANLKISKEENSLSICEINDQRTDRVLRELFVFFFPQKVSECPKSFSLFKLLVEHVTPCLIQTPKWLADEVQKEMKEFVNIGQTHKQRTNETILPANWYCDRINRTEYEAQSKDSDRHLLDLLDQILSNHHPNSLQRYDQLKKFRLAYPSIYEKRFPTHSSHLVVGTNLNHS
ncbi:hypothetical protein niasHT_003825 [Heterodera trifolii]|uniref:DEP domain-containing protein n=1 Tax=Heterodera trifolii TaxID=157864 RepID=A0ABD2LUX4_9BILA